jgi:hypothetical protein
MRTTRSTTTGAPRHLRTWSARGYRGRREEASVIVAIRAVMFYIGGVLTSRQFRKVITRSHDGGPDMAEA